MTRREGCVRKVALAMLLLVLLAPALGADEKDDEVARWIDALGTSKEARPFEALNALIQLGERSKKPALKLLTDKKESILRRWQAAKVLGAIHAKDAVDPLIAALDAKEHPTVAACAAEALGRIGDKRALPELKKAQKRFRDPRRRHPYDAAIAKLEGRTPPPYPHANASGPWKQPAIKTGTRFSEQLPWVATIKEALERAKQEKKLVLATVVAVQDGRWSSGYADHVAELAGVKPHPWGDARAMAIDAGLVKERVMMATWFTDPDIASLVRQHFVPVRVRLHTYHFDPKAPSKSADPLSRLGTSALDIGAPAVVITDPRGRSTRTLGRIGTFSSLHMGGLLRAALEQAGRKVNPPLSGPKELGAVRSALRAGDTAGAEKLLGALPARLRGSHAGECAWMRGHLAEKSGRMDEARTAFEEAVRVDPEGPWGSRAALRLEPRGVQLEQWETYVPFPGKVVPASTESAWELQKDFRTLRDRVAGLLRMQAGDGSWPDPFHDVHPSSGPGSAYDRAVPRTGLVVHALVRAAEYERELWPVVEKAVRRGINFVGAFADDPKPHVWHQTYALHLQVEILRSKLLKAMKSKARARAANLVKSLAGSQSKGGWSYMPAPRIHSFNTAPVLLLLSEARDLGVKVPKEMTEKAAAFLESVRQKDDERNFHYAPTMPFPVRASSCRTALCEIALAAHTGKPDKKRIRAGLDLFFEIDPLVRDTTKIFESYFSISALHDAYHYYFGHYYAARALKYIPRSQARKLAEKQIKILEKQAEADGSFVDAQMQGKSYSTAMALLTLLEDLRYVRK